MLADLAIPKYHVGSISGPSRHRLLYTDELDGMLDVGSTRIVTARVISVASEVLLVSPPPT